MGLAVHLLDGLNEEIADYERIKRGDLSGFRLLRDVGQLLIAARAARGFSQRDLAERLGVHESQVSRGETNEYRGISLERASQVIEVLSIRVELGASLERDIEGGAAGDPGDGDLRNAVDSVVGHQQVNVTSPSS